ncbi:MAG: hypothetical protein R2851_24720 [Caldilineaceae bacterium]
MGYQAVFFLAFAFGVIGTLSFSRIPEPAASAQQAAPWRGDLRRALRQSPEFVGLVIGAFVWNLALQVAGPFFYVYLVNGLGGTTATVGMVVSITSAAACSANGSSGGRWIEAVRCGCRRGGSLHRVPAVGVARHHRAVARGDHQPLRRLLVGRLQPRELQPAAGTDAGRATPARGRALPNGRLRQRLRVSPLLGGYIADAYDCKANFALSGAGRLVAMGLFIWLSARPARRHGKGRRD